MKKLVRLFFCFKRKKNSEYEEYDEVEHVDETKERENLERDVDYIENSNVSWMRGSNRLQNQVIICFY
jgi:hypothetical protein